MTANAPQIINITTVADMLSGGPLPRSVRDAVLNPTAERLRALLTDPALNERLRADYQAQLDEITRLAPQGPSRYAPFHRAVAGADGNRSLTQAVLAYGRDALGTIQAAALALITERGDRRLAFQLPPSEEPYIIMQRTPGSPSAPGSLQRFAPDTSLTSVRDGVYVGADFTNTTRDSTILVYASMRDASGRIVMVDGQPQPGRLVAQFSGGDNHFGQRQQTLAGILDHFRNPHRTPAPTLAR